MEHLNALRYDWQVLFQPRRLYNEGWCANTNVSHPKGAFATWLDKLRQTFNPTGLGYDTNNTQTVYALITALIAAVIVVGIVTLEVNRRRRNQGDDTLNKPNRKSSGGSVFYDLHDTKGPKDPSVDEPTMVQKIIESIIHPERRTSRLNTSTNINAQQGTSAAKNNKKAPLLVRLFRRNPAFTVIVSSVILGSFLVLTNAIKGKNRRSHAASKKANAEKFRFVAIPQLLPKAAPQGATTRVTQ